MFEVPLASEISNLLNFLVLDVLVLPFIAYTSSRLAGFANYAHLQKKDSVSLIEFDVPLVGGGLVMSKGWRRIMFVALRVSVVIAVAVSNFGLEGRTSQAMVTRQGDIRVPGTLQDPEKTITEVALSRVRCYTRVDDPTVSENQTVIYGSVIDGVCYKGVKDFVYVHDRTFFRQINATAENCVPSFNCDNVPYPTTTYRCDYADVVCTGVPENSGCSNQDGIRRNTFGELECYSISYEEGDNYVWFCNKDKVFPGTKATLNDCWGFTARREDVQSWNETFPSITLMYGKALFASAYGAEQRLEVTVPEGKRPVTGVRLWWVLSVAWVGAVALFFTVWVCVHVLGGSKETVHDEHGLVNLLQRRLVRTGGENGRFDDLPE